MQRVKLLTNASRAFFSVKFPRTTAAGILAETAKERPFKDVLYFHKQNLRWSLKELDKYASALAYGLVENSYIKGEKILIWLDSEEHAPEILATIMGCGKAGVEVIICNEVSVEGLKKILKVHKCKGLIFSPEIINSKGIARIQEIYSIFPQLMNEIRGSVGEGLGELRNILQCGTSSLAGTQKFQEMLVYATPSMSSVSLPNIHPEDPFLSFVEDESEEVTSYTHEQLLKASEKMFLETGLGNSHSLLLTHNLNMPISIAAFIGSLEQKSYLSIPGVFNLSTIYRLLRTQQATALLCHKQFYETIPPNELMEEMGGDIEQIRDVVVDSPDELEKVNPLFQIEGIKTHYYAMTPHI